jgi:hypothetical protein
MRGSTFVPTIRTPAVFAPVRVCARYGFLAIRSFSPPPLGSAVAGSLPHLRDERLGGVAHRLVQLVAQALLAGRLEPLRQGEEVVGALGGEAW